MLHVPNLFAASMVVEPFSSTYLRAGIGGAQNIYPFHHLSFSYFALENIYNLTN